jgi:hypothetical protein
VTRYFLKKLRIEGFRGINNFNRPLELKFRDDAVNSVFAINALGKSSIFEAICYAIRGNIQKLDDLPAADRGSEYYCNLFHSSRKSNIELTFAPNDDSQEIIINVGRSPDGIRHVSSPSGYFDPEAFLKSLDSELALLDHKTFQKFIEETPLNRGRSFSALLGSSKLSELRQILNVLSDTRNINNDFKLNVLETEYKNLIEAEKSLQDRICQNYGRITGKEKQDVSNHKNIACEATDVLKKAQLIKPFLVGKDILNADFESIHEAIKKAEGSDKRNELSNAIRSIAELERLEPISNESEEQNQLKQYIKEKNQALSKTRGSLFKKLYEVVQEVLHSEKWEDPYTCPVCNTKLQTSLLQAMEENLKQYEIVEQAESSIVTCWNNARWISRMKNVENAPAIQNRTFEKLYSSFHELFRDKEIDENDIDNAVDHLARLEAMRQTTLKELKANKVNIEKGLPKSLVSLTQQVEYSAQLKLSIEEYRNLPSASGIKEKIKRINRWKQFIEIASALFSQAESAYSQEKTKSIDAHYRGLYAKITNNPEIIPKLKKAVGAEDLHLRLENFYGIQDVAATTLLPESYRNAFAISLYLCAAINDKPTAQFMVLDDVTSSFDAGHQYALMELLRNDVALPANPDGLQLIILSHDGLLEKYFDTFSGTKGWHHQRLSGLPPKGYVLSQAQEANHLRLEAESFLNAGDTQQAEPLLRQYLEFKILEIIREVNVTVPLDFSIRDDRKMVQNGLKAIKGAMELHKRAGTLILNSAQINDFDNIHVPALISNWVSHYPTGSTASLSPHVLKNVLDTIDQVSDCFKYDCNCSGSARRRFYRNLSSKHCGC